MKVPPNYNLEELFSSSVSHHLWKSHLFIYKPGRSHFSNLKILLSSMWDSIKRIFFKRLKKNRYSFYDKT